MMTALMLVCIWGCGNKKEDPAAAEEQTQHQEGTEINEIEMEYEGYHMHADMKNLMQGGSSTDHAEISEEVGDGAQISFVTDIANDEGSVRITGMVYVGSVEELFDLDAEGYYTEEDEAKMAEDPEYEPVPELPQAENLIGSALAAMEENTGFNDTTISGIPMKAGSGTSQFQATQNAAYVYYAYGMMDDGRILYILVNAEALGCQDNEAAIKDAQTRIENWIAELEIQIKNS